MSLKDLINAGKMGVRILIATDKLGETMKIAKEHDAISPVCPVCPVCSGTYQVGEDGAKVNCPACIVIEEPRPTCRTCAGTGKVGARGHQVKCPVCA